MTFLKKLGSFLAKAALIATGLEPLIAPYLGSKAAPVATAVNDLTQIGQVVVQAEALLQGSGRGADKLAAAAPLVQHIVQTSEMVSGKKIANESLFVSSCQQLTSAIAGILNSIDENQVKQA